MFGNLKEFIHEEATLTINKDGNPTPRDLQIAVVIVLMELSYSDALFRPEEIRETVRTMNRAFSLEDIAVGELLEVAEVLRKDPTKVARFTAMLKDQFNTEQKQLILAMLWKLLIADGRIDTTEQQHVIEMRNFFGLSLEQAAHAREMAELNKV